ncbi:MAG TPA: hypothetical protein VLD83_16965 [Candidatus Binatia bacterium]|nr:hypothetical protein [Candidatus Binatia bacterium]
MKYRARLLINRSCGFMKGSLCSLLFHCRTAASNSDAREIAGQLGRTGNFYPAKVPLSGDCGFENVALTVIFIGDVFLGIVLFEALPRRAGVIEPDTRMILELPTFWQRAAARVFSAVL